MDLDEVKKDEKTMETHTFGLKTHGFPLPNDPLQAVHRLREVAGTSFKGAWPWLVVMDAHPWHEMF